LSSVVASQIDIHRKYGGVVPELASREHLRQIVPVVREAMAEAGLKFEEVGCDWRDARAGAGGVVAGGHHLWEDAGGGAGQAAGAGESSGRACARCVSGSVSEGARAAVCLRCA